MDCHAVMLGPFRTSNQGIPRVCYGSAILPRISSLLQIPIKMTEVPCDDMETTWMTIPLVLLHSPGKPRCCTQDFLP